MDHFKRQMRMIHRRLDAFQRWNNCEDAQVVLWDQRMRCYEAQISKEERFLEDKQNVNVFNKAFTDDLAGWRYDIQVSDDDDLRSSSLFSSGGDLLPGGDEPEREDDSLGVGWDGASGDWSGAPGLGDHLDLIELDRYEETAAPYHGGRFRFSHVVYGPPGDSVSWTVPHEHGWIIDTPPGPDPVWYSRNLPKEPTIQWDATTTKN